MINFAVTINTYERADRKTITYLKRAIDSIFNQSYQNFKIFLIGDKYENEEELINLLSKYDSSRLFFKNLDFAKERDNYKDNPMALWSYGGVNAVNVGIKQALTENYEYICHLDHDDFWFPNHLEEINNCILTTNADWICTKCMYRTKNNFLPATNSKEKYQNFIPAYGKLIHSSVCMNFKKIPLEYRDLYDLFGDVGLPSDGDLWERSKIVIRESKLVSIFINKLTCSHLEEGYERKH